MVVTRQRLEEAFVGAVTVGERGQVVIPAEAREALDIRAKDKLLVFLPPDSPVVTFAKLSGLKSAIEEFQKIIDYASSISPWGYCLEEHTTAECMA